MRHHFSVTDNVCKVGGLSFIHKYSEISYGTNSRRSCDGNIRSSQIRAKLSTPENGE